MPLTPLQRLLSKLLPWFDPDEQDRRMARADQLAEAASRIESVRIAYRDAGARVDRRRR